jgi:hypothetical protein
VSLSALTPAQIFLKSGFTRGSTDDGCGQANENFAGVERI